MNKKQFITVKDGKIISTECSCGKKNCRHLRTTKMWVLRKIQNS